MKNLFDWSDEYLSEELVTVLAKNENVKIERIISKGHITGWYDQVETEFVALLSGQAVLEYENGNKITLNKGDTILIKPHEKHRVTYTSSNPPCCWLCVFYL